MRALVIGHDHVAGLEHLNPALVANGYELTRLNVVPRERFLHPDVDMAFPEPGLWDLIVTLGAPWARSSVDRWSTREVEFLASAQAQGAAVLGICFGAHLLAESLGGGTLPLSASRIGWYDVRSRDARVGEGPWFHWNAEQLVAPAEAEILAESDDGVEVFRYGRSTGIQFHPEMTPDLLERWLKLPSGVPAGVDLSVLRHATASHASRAKLDTAALLRLLPLADQ